MAQDYSQVNFRIPTKLKEKIESASLENNRSITAELVSRLEKSFDTNQPYSSFENMPFFDALGILSDLCEKRGFHFIVYNKSALTPDDDGYVKIKMSNDDLE